MSRGRFKKLGRVPSRLPGGDSHHTVWLVSWAAAPQYIFPYRVWWPFLGIFFGGSVAATFAWTFGRAVGMPSESTRNLTRSRVYEARDLSERARVKRSQNACLRVRSGSTPAVAARRPIELRHIAFLAVSLNRMSRTVQQNHSNAPK